MGNFAEMFLPPGQGMQQDPQADRNRLIQLLTQAHQPEQMAELQIAPEQSFSGQMADRALAALADGFKAAAGGGGGYSAIEALQRQREDRQARIDYNARARASNKSSAGRAAAGAEAEVLGGELKDSREGTRRQNMLATLRSRGIDLDPQTEAIFLATGDIDRPKPTDELGELGKAATLGEKGVVDQVPDKYRPAAQAARTASEKRDKDKGDKEPKGQFAGFNTQAELASAIARETDDEMRASNAETLVDVPFDDPLTGLQSVRKQVVMKPTISISEARRRAMARFPGAEKHLSGYGSEPPAEKKTGGVSADAVMKKIRARDAAKR